MTHVLIWKNGGEKMKKLDIEATGKNIKQTMKSHNIKVKDVQRICYISKEAIYKWFRGESLPTIDKFALIAELCHTTIDEMLRFQDGE